MKVEQQTQNVDKATQEQKENIEKQVTEILASYEGNKSNLIPILQQVQQKCGYLPEDALRQIAKFTNQTESTVFGVATFYAQFKLVPGGKNVIRVCRGTACHVRGGARILRETEKQLGIKQGESTSDMEFALETVACIGACALAPNITVNNATYGQVTTRKVGEILGKYRNGNHAETRK